MRFYTRLLLYRNLEDKQCIQSYYVCLCSELLTIAVMNRTLPKAIIDIECTSHVPTKPFFALKFFNLCLKSLEN